MEKVEIENIKELICEVSKLLEKRKERKKITGEDFNIFEILGVAHFEVSTHSAFIANLLNPNGTHCQGAIFLEEFLKLIKIERFNVESANVWVEQSVNEGRIDILITDNKNCIVIENKIYAGLQEDQLGRYVEYLNKNNFENKKLVFLTLQDKLKEEDFCKLLEGQEVKKEDFNKCINIDYDDIKKWLESFTSITHPRIPLNIMVTISQYINLIERLKQMKTENDNILNILKDEKFLSAYVYLKQKELVSLNEAISKIKEKIENSDNHKESRWVSWNIVNKGDHSNILIFESDKSSELRFSIVLILNEFGSFFAFSNKDNDPKNISILGDRKKKFIDIINDKNMDQDSRGYTIYKYLKFSLDLESRLRYVLCDRKNEDPVVKEILETLDEFIEIAEKYIKQEEQKERKI